jgi:ABC-2 type transport system permease protein
MQYRASFLMLGLGQFCITGAEFLAIVFLFHRFGQLRGWRLEEVALLYAMSSSSLALAGAAATGFDGFGDMLKRGDFDRLLLRPRSPALQLAGQRFTLRRLGRLAQGLAVLAYALAHLGISWTPGRVLLLVASILGGACLFYAVFVLEATLAFWTLESLEVMNTLSYGGATAAQYPISIYQGAFRDLMIYVLPLACMNYFPALALLGRADPLGFPPWVGWASPLAGPAFLAAALVCFRVGVRHYQSTGS